MGGSGGHLGSKTGPKCQKPPKSDFADPPQGSLRETIFVNFRDFSVLLGVIAAFFFECRFVGVSGAILVDFGSIFELIFGVFVALARLLLGRNPNRKKCVWTALAWADCMCGPAALFSENEEKHQKSTILGAISRAAGRR